MVNSKLVTNRLISSMVLMACSFLVSLPLSLTVLGQDKSEYYTVMYPEKFEIDWTGFYEKLDKLTTETRKELPHKLDLAFGEHPKQKLDLYFPSEDPVRAPVFLFIHGGGFREGDRAHYGFVAKSFSRRGYITAVTSYRMTSKGFYYPSQPEDIQEALAWLYRNIADHGGDPDRIYVGGHSAGGILTAEVCVRGGWLKEKGLAKDMIKGCAPISTSMVVGDPEAALGGGIYSVRKSEGNAYVSDPERRQEADPLQNIDMAPPTALFAAGTEEAILHDSAREFVKRLKEMGSKAEVLILEDHDHADTVLVLADDQSTLFIEIMRIFEP